MAAMPAPALPCLQSSASPRLTQPKAQRRAPGEASFFRYEPRFKNGAGKVLPGERLGLPRHRIPSTANPLTQED